MSLRGELARCSERIDSLPRLLETSFITGSRVYGSPRDDSDLDIVVLVNPELAKLLADLCDPMKPGEKGVYRFGKLNLIVTFTQEEFACWKIATDDLIALSLKGNPATREEAIKYIDSIFEQNGVSTTKY